MKKFNYILAITTAIILLLNYSNLLGSNQSGKKNKASITKTDSAELTTLVRDLYKWRTTVKSSDYPYKFRNPSDSIFTGIDWDLYSKNTKAFKNTNFFTNDFFKFHRAIALRIDSSITQAKIEWRNINDGIPLWETGADEWCKCQDSPDNYWKTITLNDFIFVGDTLIFNWTWGNGNNFEANKYTLKANNVWKISYIEGFNDYGTFADYNKTMNN